MGEYDVLTGKNVSIKKNNNNKIYIYIYTTSLRLSEDNERCSKFIKLRKESRNCG